jgi:8-oxo-dGTP pyrophosphatase MutT (NUDIX family)
MTEHAAGIVLFRRRRRREYIVLRYTTADKYFGLVKGGSEVGEEPMVTALREAKEETGLSAITRDPNFQIKTHYVYTRDGQQISKDVIWFLGEVHDQHDGILSAEHSELHWLPYEEAIKLITHEKDRGVVRKAEEFLQTRKNTP